MPCHTISNPAPLEKIPSVVGLGLRSIRFPSAFSMPSARPGSESVTMFTQSRCTGERIVKCRMEATNMMMISAIFVDSWNWSTFRTLS